MRTYSESDLSNLIKKNKDIFFPASFVELHGTLGAGKSTFVKYFLEQFFPEIDYGGSPSFPLMNLYSSQETQIVHIDFYRLETIEECEQAGLLEEMLPAKNKIVFCEWLDRFPELKKQMFVFTKKSKLNYIDVYFEITKDGESRSIKFDSLK